MCGSRKIHVRASQGLGFRVQAASTKSARNGSHNLETHLFGVKALGLGCGMPVNPLSPARRKFP